MADSVDRDTSELEGERSGRFRENGSGGCGGGGGGGSGGGNYPEPELLGYTGHSIGLRNE